MDFLYNKRIAERALEECKKALTFKSENKFRSGFDANSDMDRELRREEAGRRRHRVRQAATGISPATPMEDAVDRLCDYAERIRTFRGGNCYECAAIAFQYIHETYFEVRP